MQYPYFKPKMSRGKCKSSSDVVGTTVLFKILYCKILNVYFVCLSFFFCICVKSIINLLWCNTRQKVVSWLPRLTL